jgi:cardiolipin synthase
VSLRWVPNAICVLRVLLVAPIVATLLHREFGIALILIGAAGVSDGLDGFLAKRFEWRTRLGGLLDPAADKLLVTSVFVSLTYLGLVPIPVTAIVVGRDLLIVGGALAYQLLIGELRGEPTSISKLNTACQLGFVIFSITHAGFAWPPQISLTVLGAAVVFTSLVSGLNYVLAWSRRAWRQRHATP